MGLIARDERKWTIRRSGAASWNVGLNAEVEGPHVTEAVEVVPASQLAGAVETLATIAKPGENTSALVNAAGYARNWLIANGHPDPWGGS